MLKLLRYQTVRMPYRTTRLLAAKMSTNPKNDNNHQNKDEGKSVTDTVRESVNTIMDKTKEASSSTVQYAKEAYEAAKIKVKEGFDTTTEQKSEAYKSTEEESKGDNKDKK